MEWKEAFPKMLCISLLLVLVKIIFTCLQVPSRKAYMETHCVKLNPGYSYGAEKQCSWTRWNEGDLKLHTLCQKLQSGDKFSTVIGQMVYPTSLFCDCMWNVTA